MRAALADAAQGRAVGLLTRLLLLCRGDDAALGRYTPGDRSGVHRSPISRHGGLRRACFVAIRRRRHG